LKKITLVVLISIFYISGFAVEPPPKKKMEMDQKVATPKKATLRMALSPLEPSVLDAGKLGPTYSGLPPLVIANALDKILRIEKGEFETTADFEVRKASQLSGKYIQNLKLSDIHAFSTIVRKMDSYKEGISYKFDADNSEVGIFVAPRAIKPNGIGGPIARGRSRDEIVDTGTQRLNRASLDTFELFTRETESRDYEGSNAYGAKVTVHKTVSDVIKLGATSLRLFTLTMEVRGEPVPGAKFKLESSRAIKELPLMRALFVAKLVSPYLEYDFQHFTPTKDDPYDFTSKVKIIRGDIDEIVIFSGLTGEIFVRIPNQNP